MTLKLLCDFGNLGSPRNARIVKRCTCGCKCSEVQSYLLSTASWEITATDDPLGMHLDEIKSGMNEKTIVPLH